MDLENQDIRWHQRFENYQKALVRLNNAVALSEERELTDLEKQGLIQGFEYTHELAWKTMKDFLEGQGETKIIGSKNATRLAFKNEIILEGQVWMDMIDDRNLTSHTYNEDVTEKIYSHIVDAYAQEFIDFEKMMTTMKTNLQ